MTAMRLKRYPSPSGGIALGKMGVGATMLKQGKTARDYVQSGLVAMWDGIENAGWGTHDPNATVWADLSGNGHLLEFVGGATLLDNRAEIPLEGYATTNGLTFGTPCTQEMVCSITQYQSYGRMVAENRGLTLTGDNKLGHLYGWGVDTNIVSVAIPRNPFSMCLIASSQRQAILFYCGSLIGTTGVKDATYTGQTTFFNRASLGRGLAGSIYNIRFYSRALTADEIARNYAIDKERFNLP